MSLPDEITIVIEKEHVDIAAAACDTNWSPSCCLFAQAVKSALGLEENPGHTNSRGFRVWDEERSLHQSYKIEGQEEKFTLSGFVNKFDAAFAYPHEPEAVASREKVKEELKDKLPFTIKAIKSSY